MYYIQHVQEHQLGMIKQCDSFARKRMLRAPPKLLHENISLNANQHFDHTLEHNLFDRQAGESVLTSSTVAILPEYKGNAALYFVTMLLYEKNRQWTKRSL